MIIRNEQPTDYRAVENLTRETFGNVYRTGCTEQYSDMLHRILPSLKRWRNR